MHGVFIGSHAISHAIAEGAVTPKQLKARPVATAVGLLDAMVRAGHVTEERLCALTQSGKGRWRASRVAVVMPLVDEGPHHFEDEKIVEDDERYRRLKAAGWTVVRLSAADLRDMEAVIARIREVLDAVPAVG